MRDIQSPNSRYTATQDYLREQTTDVYLNSDKKSSRYIILGFLISLTLIGFVAFLASFVFDGATITIKPLKKDLAINETYIITPENRQNMLVAKDIPLSEQVALPKNSVKKVSARAGGEITIYNNFGAQSQKLIKGTRFSTSDGKIFRIQDSVTIPGKSGSSPGSVKARVVADSEGEEYNIGPTRFSIPGFKGSPKYEGFYGESSKNMSGGSSGKSVDVSDLDMEKGKETVREKIKTALEAKMQNSVPDGYSFSKDANFITYGGMNLIDSDNTTATYEMLATATVVYLKRDDLIKSIVEKTQDVNTSNASVEIVSSKDFVISIVDLNDIADPLKPVRLIITGNAPVVFRPNKEKVVDFVLGIPKADFTGITKKIQYIDEARSTIRPFWATSFPDNRDKIEVVLEE
jgi:flagellar basal body-associated protein FliL